MSGWLFHPKTNPQLSTSIATLNFASNGPKCSKNKS
jgi:hypothetical protein